MPSDALRKNITLQATRQPNPVYTVSCPRHPSTSKTEKTSCIMRQPSCLMVMRGDLLRKDHACCDLPEIRRINESLECTGNRRKGGAGPDGGQRQEPPRCETLRPAPPAVRGNEAREQCVQVQSQPICARTSHTGGAVICTRGCAQARCVNTFALPMGQKDRTAPRFAHSRVRECGTSGHAAAH